jgi:hypothetical protein
MKTRVRLTDLLQVGEAGSVHDLLRSHSLGGPPPACRIRFDMKPPKYTAEQIKEIVDRILELRTRWLRVVEAQLASQQSRRDFISEKDAGTKVAGGIG